MLTFEEAQEAIALIDVGDRAWRVERIALGDALGRVLAEEIPIDRDQPGFDRATMDGYAVVPDGDTKSFRVVGTVTAGTMHEGTLSPGEAVRIMTGAPAPAGTSVVPIERTDGGASGDTVTLEVVPRLGANIAKRGEDAHEGDVLVVRGMRLAPAHLSVIALAGRSEVEVFQRPNVAVVTTGDEVGSNGTAGIRNTNGPLLEGLLRSIGVNATRRHAKDDEGELREAIERACSSADVIVTTGGVSMGDHDLVPDALANLGFEIVFHQVQMKPGKPVLIARRGDGVLFVGLPGNPVSVLATAHLFLFPTLCHYLGGWHPNWIDIPLAEAYSYKGERHLFLPGMVDGTGLRPAHWHGSGDLIAAAAGDGLIDIPAGSNFVAGERVRFLPYVGHALCERALLPPREYQD